MVKLDAGETVVSSLVIRNAAGTLVSPATSMKITIVDPGEAAIATDATMTEDSTGMYHYDYNSSATAAKGIYRVTYTATDGSRITIQKETFELT